MDGLKKRLAGVAFFILLAFVFVLYIPTLAEAPTNDDVATPIEITALPFYGNYDTSEATAAPTDPYPSCNYGPMQATVWFRFVPTETMYITIATDLSLYSTVVGVYAGTPAAANEIACAVNPYSYSLSFQITGGVTYYIEVGALNGGWYPPPSGFGGDLWLVIEQVLPPANDNFADSHIITELPFIDSEVSPLWATVEQDEPRPSCTNNDGFYHTIWYTFTPSESRSFVLDLDTFDPFIALYTGFSDEERVYESCTRWNVARLDAGRTYHIQVGERSLWVPWLNFSLDIAPDPNASFSYYKEYYGIRSYHFFNNSYDPACPSGCWATFQWDFGDSTTSSDWEAYHEYASDGDYLVTLTMTTTDGRSGTMQQLVSVVTPPPVVGFYINPYDPSIFDEVTFYNWSYDPACWSCGNLTAAWDFGDGVSSSEWSPMHRYANDGDYTVNLTVTTSDGRSAAMSPLVSVRTHDVAITRFTVPQAASVGQTRQIFVEVNNTRYPETVEVQLYKSAPWGWQWIGSLEMLVPVRPANRTTAFKFSYTFTAEDAAMGRINFRAVAMLKTARDALPMGNEAISLPTKINP